MDTVPCRLVFIVKQQLINNLFLSQKPRLSLSVKIAIINMEANIKTNQSAQGLILIYLTSLIW